MNRKERREHGITREQELGLIAKDKASLEMVGGRCICEPTIKYVHLPKSRRPAKVGYAIIHSPECWANRPTDADLEHGSVSKMVTAP